MLGTTLKMLRNVNLNWCQKITILFNIVSSIQHAYFDAISPHELANVRVQHESVSRFSNSTDKSVERLDLRSKTIGVSKQVGSGIRLKLHILRSDM